MGRVWSDGERRAFQLAGVELGGDLRRDLGCCVVVEIREMNERRVIVSEFHDPGV